MFYNLNKFVNKVMPLEALIDSWNPILRFTKPEEKPRAILRVRIGEPYGLWGYRKFSKRS